MADNKAGNKAFFKKMPLLIFFLFWPINPFPEVCKTIFKDYVYIF